MKLYPISRYIILESDQIASLYEMTGYDVFDYTKVRDVDMNKYKIGTNLVKYKFGKWYYIIK